MRAHPPPDVANGYKWELYNVAKDWTQDNDLAKANPEKLKELQDLFWVEAAKFQVLPLDNALATRFASPKPSLTAGRSTFSYTTQVTGIPRGDAPNVLNRSFSITAEVDVKADDEGMLNTNGGRFAGYGLYLAQGQAGVHL